MRRGEALDNWEVSNLSTGVNIMPLIWRGGKGRVALFLCV